MPVAAHSIFVMACRCSMRPKSAFAACYFLKKRSHKSRRAYQMNGKIKKTLSGLCSISKNISWPRSNARSSTRLMRFEKIPIDSR